MKRCRKIGKKELGLSKFLKVLGALCLIYCLSIALFMGYGSNFFLIWAFLAAGFLGWGRIISHQEWMARIPKWLKRSFILCVIVGGLFFAIIEGLIFSRFADKAEPDADYVIILGAQWKENGPSYVLQKRLDKAIEYLKENPDTKVIVSGGQGSNEPISEARGMQGYLISGGIETERILVEEKSTSTYENLAFCGKLLNKEKDRVVLVSSNFHMFRARKIAIKQGYARIEGLAAASYPGMLPNNLFREFFGVVKDFMVGNM